jgi:predicted nucleic acid-binding protein
MYLVDTSVWVEVFRKRSRLSLETLTDMDEVVTCLPVIQEVLQGFRDESAFQIARTAMFAMPVVACAIFNNLTVLHRDRDFESLARISTLETRSV